MAALTPRTERRLLGGAAKRIREAKRIKQDTIAQAIGVHPAYLSNLERGKKQPSLDLQTRLAGALAVDLDDITYLTCVYEVADSAA